MSFGVGEYVIRQGDMGDKFFIVVEGQLVAEKKDESNTLLIQRESKMWCITTRLETTSGRLPW